jgi:hypothetical protein
MFTKDAINPNRLVGKALTCCPACPDTPDKYVMQIDGLTAGQIIQLRSRYERTFWVWILTGPSYPSNQPVKGEAESLEAAARAFKHHFLQWRAWAKKQDGPVAWYRTI